MENASIVRIKAHRGINTLEKRDSVFQSTAREVLALVGKKAILVAPQC